MFVHPGKSIGIQVEVTAEMRAGFADAQNGQFHGYTWEGWLPSLKLTSSLPLKMDGWSIKNFLRDGLFSGTMLVFVGVRFNTLFGGQV